MRGSSYLPLPDWLARKKAIVNPHNDDEECFKWLVITAENVGMKDPQRVSNLRSLPKITIDISVNMLAVEGRDIYIHRKGWRMMGQEINC